MPSETADSSTVRCPACGAVNRVQLDKFEQGLAPVCGNCGKPLPTGAAEGSAPLTITDATFATEVERASTPVLVDFWAPWCGPCRMIAPAIEQLAIDFAGRARVAKLNIDDNQAAASRFRVASIPTMLVFKDGREVDRIVGLQSKAAIAERLERWLK